MSMDSRANEDALPWAHLYEQARTNDHITVHGATAQTLIDQLRQSIADTRTLRQALELIEHKADQRLQGQYTEGLMLGIILKTARTALLTPEARAALKETERA